MTKSTYVKAVSFTLAVAVLAGGVAIYYGMKANKYEDYIVHMSDKAYSEIISSLSNVSVSLEKLQYAESPTYLNTVAAQVWREAAMAKTALSLLPLGEVKLDQTEKFVAQAGEYAYSILRRGRNENTGENITMLAQTANDLTTKLWEVKNQINTGEMTFESMDSKGAFSSTSMSDNFSQLEQEFPQMGTLIYDGPFSDHIEQMTPALLENAQDMAQEQALEHAKAFTGDAGLSFTSEGGDKIPFYMFTSDSGLSIQVTKKGGYTLQMTKPTEPTARNLSDEDAVLAAKQFLNDRGYPGMKESYFTVFENIMTINFAYAENDIIAYPDLIKVGVDMEKGTVISFESRGYIMSHKSRELPKAKLSMADAKGKLQSGLTVEKENMAVIPTTGANEVFCYEFLCVNAEGQKVLVYIDTQTGEEESMFILIEDENGTLTM